MPYPNHKIPLPPEKVGEPEPSGWRLIETAPKDRAILVAWKAKDGAWLIWNGRWVGELGCWCSAHTPAYSILGAPTHWMPLPEPPSV